MTPMRKLNELINLLQDNDTFMAYVGMISFSEQVDQRKVLDAIDTLHEITSKLNGGF